MLGDLAYWPDTLLVLPHGLFTDIACNMLEGGMSEQRRGEEQREGEAIHSLGQNNLSTYDVACMPLLSLTWSRACCGS